MIFRYENFASYEWQSLFKLSLRGLPDLFKTLFGALFGVKLNDTYDLQVAKTSM